MAASHHAGQVSCSRRKARREPPGDKVEIIKVAATAARWAHTAQQGLCVGDIFRREW